MDQTELYCEIWSRLTDEKDAHETACAAYAAQSEREAFAATGVSEDQIDQAIAWYESNAIFSAAPMCVECRCYGSETSYYVVGPNGDHYLGGY